MRRYFAGEAMPPEPADDEGAAAVARIGPMDARVPGHLARSLGDQLAEHVGHALAHGQLVETKRIEVRSRRGWVVDWVPRRRTAGGAPVWAG